jgi:putative restriction endonuclease
MANIDARVRLEAFEWLKEQCLIYGDTLPRKILEQGFIVDSTRVPLIGPQGIFIPKILGEIPLTITTSPNSPYADEHTPDGFLMYRYRGTNPQHRENVGLRTAMIRKIPLIYLFGVVPGKYLPSWPVYIMGDDPTTLTFKVAVDEKQTLAEQSPISSAYVARSNSEEDAKRRYLTVQTRQRLHQQQFRERVLQAYHEQCAMCRLRHPELLEAVHIIPDSEPKGDPVVPNGISLCNLHHTAFDRYVLGIRPDFVVEVRRDVLEEEDGPMLRHGLQAMNNQKIILPRSASNRPDPDRLELRYNKFKNFMPN